MYTLLMGMQIMALYMQYVIILFKSITTILTTMHENKVEITTPFQPNEVEENPRVATGNQTQGLLL